MIARHLLTFAIAVALAGMDLVPLSQTRAQRLPAAGTVLIRYHFVAGQRATYKVALKETEGYSSTIPRGARPIM